MSWSIITAWASISYCNHVAHGATPSNLCIMCCMNVLLDVQFYRACMTSPDLSSRRRHWFSLAIMLFLVLRHPTCASCIAWMCCRTSNSIKHVWACPDLSSRRGHRFLIEFMLLIVLRHPTCVSCVPWMCCRMSNSIKHVWACPDLSFDPLGLYTFLHSLRSNFSPSRPLPLSFEAACKTSFAGDTYTIQSTPKSRRGRYCFICLFCRRGW